MKPYDYSCVPRYLLLETLVMAMLLAASFAQSTNINATLAPPICNLKCPENYTCFDNSSKAVSTVWGHNGLVCANDLECYGEADPRGHIRGPKQFPTTMQEGDILSFESYLGRFRFQPFNATREAFDKCTPFSQGQAVIASESSSFTVPEKFLTAGTRYFIAISSSFLYRCDMGLRAEVFVQSRQPCLNPQAEDMGVCSTKGLCASNGHFFTRNYSCLCCTGYIGQYCEELDSCSPTVNPCQNEANCTEITAGHEMKFKCTCVPGFTGQMCEINIDECKPKPCVNGGFCTDKVNGYECLCPPGVLGTNCEVVIPNLCQPNPCLNGGTCERSGNQRKNYTCYCAEGLTGRNCTENVTSSSVVILSSSVNLPSSSLQVSRTSSFQIMSTSAQVSSEQTFDVSSEVVSMLQTVTSTPVLKSNEVSVVVKDTTTVGTTPGLSLNFSVTPANFTKSILITKTQTVSPTMQFSHNLSSTHSSMVPADFVSASENTIQTVTSEAFVLSLMSSSQQVSSSEHTEYLKSPVVEITTLPKYSVSDVNLPSQSSEVKRTILQAMSLSTMLIANVTVLGTVSQHQINTSKLTLATIAETAKQSGVHTQQFSSMSNLDISLSDIAKPTQHSTINESPTLLSSLESLAATKTQHFLQSLASVDATSMTVNSQHISNSLLSSVVLLSDIVKPTRHKTVSETLKSSPGTLAATKTLPALQSLASVDATSLTVNSQHSSNLLSFVVSLSDIVKPTQHVKTSEGLTLQSSQGTLAASIKSTSSRSVDASSVSVYSQRSSGLLQANKTSDAGKISSLIPSLTPSVVTSTGPRQTAFVTSSFRVEATATASYVGIEASTTIPVLPESTSSFVIKTLVTTPSDGLMVSTSSVEGTPLMNETVGLSSLLPSSSTQETRTVTQHILATSSLFFGNSSAKLSPMSSIGVIAASSVVLQPSDISSLKPSPVASSTAAVDGSSVGVSPSQTSPELTNSVSTVASSSVLPTSHMLPTSTPPVPTTQPIYNLTCADNPCANNGTCRTVDSLLKFKCECPDGTWGPLCSKEFDLHFPRFSSNSFLVVYKPIAFTSNGNKIVMTFSTKASDGLLFYSVHSEHRDFIELRVVDGKLEFRFDPGDSLVVLTSEVSVNTGEKITAVVSYDTETRIGSLTVDNNTAITGRARGKLYGINLNGMWYIGGVPSGLIIRPGVQAAKSPGFQGCIRDIEFNEVLVKANDSVKWYNIDECDTPACGRNPCKNDAVCEEEKSNPHEYLCRCASGFSGTNCEVHSACASDPCNGGVCVQHMNNISLPVCLCPYEKAGRLCEERVSVTVPSFTTLHSYASYLEYKRPETGSKSFDVMFQFRAESTVNGLIVYVGQNTYLGGGDDFFAVGINNDKLVLQYNLGSGVANIESAQNISTDWHVVTAGRKGRNGYLYVDGSVTYGQSPGELAGLNIFTPLYVGGVPSFNQLPNVVLFKKGFQGSVYNVTIRLDGRTYQLSTSGSSSPDKWNIVEGLNVKNESFDDCKKEPCKNGGVCSEMGATFVCNCTDGWEGLYCTGRKVPCIGYNPCSLTSTCRPHGVSVKCDCSLGLTGEFCKQDIILTPPLQFNNLSYIAFKPKTIKAETKIRIRFKPTTNSGILFYVAQSLQSHRGDFLSITLHDGFVQFRYDLGSGVGKGQSTSRVTLNQWHVVTANRSSQTGSLQLDGGNVVPVLSPSRAIGLDVQSDFYLGGVPQLSSVSPRAVENTNDLKDYSGCIGEFKVNKNTFSLTRSGASEGRNIGNCAGDDVKTFR